jgi:hypothetical protein
MPNLKAGLTKKIGPLPAWGWAVAIGGGILAFRLFRGGGSHGSDSVIGGGGDASTPTGVNPIASILPGSSSGITSPLPVPGSVGGGGTSGGGVGSTIVSTSAPKGIYDFPNIIPPGGWSGPVAAPVAAIAAATTAAKATIGTVKAVPQDYGDKAGYLAERAKIAAPVVTKRPLEDYGDKAGFLIEQASRATSAAKATPKIVAKLPATVKRPSFRKPSAPVKPRVAPVRSGIRRGSALIAD